MIVLGIETSCDETAVAIIGDDKRIYANLVLSQMKEHAAFGGVVPEIAARAHTDHLPNLVRAALSESGLGWDDITAVAATCGPGLIGGLLVGMMTAKGIAAARGLPFIPVNHLEGHALSARLAADIAFPYLMLLVSGGHTQILLAQGPGRYRALGATLDDAAGECFDKSAKLMGLGYPGGPQVEIMARACKDPARAAARFALPRPLQGRPGCDFSFSGLKTAMRQHIDALPPGKLRREDVADLCAALQGAIAAALADRCARALKNCPAPPPPLVVCGGVAANEAVRAALMETATQAGTQFFAPPLALCGDNAAMIAWAGIEHLQAGLAPDTDPLAAPARPRWPLTA